MKKWVRSNKNPTDIALFHRGKCQSFREKEYICRKNKVNTMREYQDIEPKSMKVAESAAAYCMPVSQSQNTCEDIDQYMFVLSKLTDSDKLELASKLIVSVKGTFQASKKML